MSSLDDDYQERLEDLFDDMESDGEDFSHEDERQKELTNG